MIPRFSSHVLRPAATLQARRLFGSSGRVTAKVGPARRPRERVDIPGLERVSYGERKHYVPGLSKPAGPHWERDYRDQRYYRAPQTPDMDLYRAEPCYVFNQRTTVLEGMRQALWLTKSQLISGLPPGLLSLADEPANQIPDQDERVQNAIKHARFWDGTETRPRKDKYSNTLLLNLLHVVSTLRSAVPALGRRILVQDPALAASWTRGPDRFQVRGRSGLVQTCMDPLPVVSGRQEVALTAGGALESLYPVSPSIDLQKVQVYRDGVNATGFRDDYPYGHAHTLYFLDGVDVKLRPQQFRAKMLMFAFGSALARARRQHPGSECVLDRPITVQAVGANGRIFQFMVFQLNTTDLKEDQGVKNQVWVEEDVELYDFAKVRPYIKKKEVKVAPGLHGYKPEVFRKFLAMYLHGAV